VHSVVRGDEEPGGEKSLDQDQRGSDHDLRGGEGSERKEKKARPEVTPPKRNDEPGIVKAT
jgi:hypothetical protein